MFNNLLLWQEAAAPAGEGSFLVNVVFIAVGLAIFYFFMMRPQSQQQKAAKKFNQELKKGQKVITIGGVHGTIVEMNDTTMTLNIAPKINIKYQKDSISMEQTAAAYGNKTDKA
jgi:preprotein translocase subunit YajC